MEAAIHAEAVQPVGEVRAGRARCGADSSCLFCFLLSTRAPQDLKSETVPRAESPSYGPSGPSSTRNASKFKAPEFLESLKPKAYAWST